MDVLPPQRVHIADGDEVAGEPDRVGRQGAEDRLVDARAMGQRGSVRGRGGGRIGPRIVRAVGLDKNGREDGRREEGVLKSNGAYLPVSRWVGGGDGSGDIVAVVGLNIKMLEITEGSDGYYEGSCVEGSSLNIPHKRLCQTETRSPPSR